jgi:phage FluMu protein Com
MMELELSLSFDCCGCTQPVLVKLHCAGKGLASEDRQMVAAVKIPCPTCGLINDVLFEATGKVRKVKPSYQQRPLPVPSIN